MTPQGEKVDVEFRTRRARLIIQDVDDAEIHKNITAFQREARGVARDFLALQAELEAAREREKGLRAQLWAASVYLPSKERHVIRASLASPEPPDREEQG